VAAAKGGKTRAVLKIAGRAAIAITVGLFQLASWLLWLGLMLLSACASLKRLTERTTLRLIRWRKARRARRAALARSTLMLPRLPLTGTLPLTRASPVLASAALPG
jgi:hypothetical protein